MVMETERIALQPPVYTAIVLAGIRAYSDPVARASGVCCKAMSHVGGKPMVLRVLHELEKSKHIGSRVLCGPPKQVCEQSPELKAGIDTGDWKWMENQSTPSRSAYFALQSLPEPASVLLTTADHVLLRSEIVDHFCSTAGRTGFDLAIALVPYKQVIAANPSMKRTRYRFRDGTYCGCNLFAFLTPQARKVADFWQRVEAERKRPWRVIKVLGWVSVLRFLLGNLSLDEALETLSKQLGIKIGPIILPFPEAAIDVDTVSDWRYAQKVVETNTPNTTPKKS